MPGILGPALPGFMQCNAALCAQETIRFGLSAFRVALPALINEYITIAKLTSLGSVISLAEMLLVGERLYTQNF
jgi:ABC-type amino acid transport system permease subunit